MTALRIQGGDVLVDGRLVETEIVLDGDRIAAVGADGGHGRCVDARGLLVLPGIVDIHADAFERQLMPRPGVGFPIDIALLDSDRQAVANGITTLFHGVTRSWEPGLRGVAMAREILAALEALRDRLAADTRLHLRHETFNLDAEAELCDWLHQARIGMLGFNDHMLSDEAPARNRNVAKMVERSGVTADDFLALVRTLKGRAAEVPVSVERLARAATAGGVPVLSHDDMSPEQRGWYRAIDCRIAEFPTTIETARAATEAGDDVVLGAPNVVRGGSHIGWIGAAEMIGHGFCTVLASDYYYPAPLLAAFRLDADGVAPLPQAWAYIAERPARAAGLGDRGTISRGQRADLVLVDPAGPRPRTVATMTGGRIVYLTEPQRLA